MTVELTVSAVFGVVANWTAEKVVAATCSRHQNIKNCHIEKTKMPTVNATKATSVPNNSSR